MTKHNIRRRAPRAKSDSARTAEHVERGRAAAQRYKSVKAETQAASHFCARIQVGTGAPYYSSVEAATDAVIRFSATTKLPGAGIFHVEGEGIYAVWSVKGCMDAALWAEMATKLDRLAEHYGLRLDGPITDKLPFDLDAVMAGHEGGSKPEASATDCLCVRLPIGPSGYAHETAAVEALEGFTEDRAKFAGLGRPLTVGHDDAVFGVWRFPKSVPIAAWLEMADLLEKLARGYGLKLDGTVTGKAPFDLDTLVPGTLAEAGR